MSTAVVVPPPNSSSVMRRMPRLTAQARQLLTAVNLHYAGVAALVVLDLYLLVHLLFVWQALGSSGPEALSQQRTMLTAANIAGRPLQGIDAKVADSTAQANAFYAQRLPYAQSQVLTELGVLTKREGVRFSRAQYLYAPVLSREYALTDVRIDASISGDYRSVVGFINALERDRMFFSILGITLTGQQTGQVNLRLRLLTYLRLPGPDEGTTDLPPAETDSTAPASATPAGGVQ